MITRPESGANSSDHAHASVPRAVALLAALAVALAGCGRTPPTPHDPTTVGVIANVAFVENGLATLTFSSGATTQFDFGLARSLYGGGPTAGDLFLSGSDGQGPWYVELPQERDALYRIITRPVGVGAGGLTFEFGPRLPLAPSFHDPGHAFEAGAPATYLVNERGARPRRGLASHPSLGARTPVGSLELED